MKRLNLASVVALLLLAAIVRIFCAQGELSIDEIWSLRGVETEVQRLSDVIHIRHDNNHPLNTAFLYLLGSNRADWVYRMPHVVAGVLTVGAAGWAFRRDTTTFLIAMLIVAFSYPFVYYSTEARGYAFLLLFSMLAFALLPEHGRRWDALFPACCVLGFLSHALFLAMYVSVLPVVAMQVWQRKSVREFSARMVVPMVFMTWLYFHTYHNMTIGGGPELPVELAMAQLGSFLIGGSLSQPLLFAWVALLLVLGACGVLAVRSPWKAARYVWGIWIVPFGLAFLSGRDDLSPRYFMTGILFATLLFAETAGVLWQGKRRWLVAVILCAVTAINLSSDLKLASTGRAHYREALEYIAAHTRRDLPIIAWDNEFRHRACIEYACKALPLFSYDVDNTTEVLHAEWLLFHHPYPTWVPEEEMILFNGKCVLELDYPCTWLSGWRLLVYHRVPEEESTPPRVTKPDDDAQK